MLGNRFAQRLAGNQQGSRGFAAGVGLQRHAVAAGHDRFRWELVQETLRGMREDMKLPAGSLESQSTDFTVRVKRKYAKAEDFANLPISTNANQTVSGSGALVVEQRWGTPGNAWSG